MNTLMLDTQLRYAFCAIFGVYIVKWTTQRHWARKKYRVRHVPCVNHVLLNTQIINEYSMAVSQKAICTFVSFITIMIHVSCFFAVCQ